MERLNATCEALGSETKLLCALLARNRSQHRRAGYFRALDAATSAMKRLAPAALPRLLSATPMATLAAALNLALTATAEAVRGFRRAAWALRREVASSYFLALTVAWLAIAARSLALLRPIALRLLALRRDLDSPIMFENARHGETLEWLLKFGDGSAISGRAGAKATAVSTQVHHLDDPAVNGDEGSNDLGERVAFFPEIPSTFKVASTALAQAAHDTQTLLAADYSDSDDEGGATCLAAGRGREPVSSEEGAWCMDHGPSGSLDFFSATLQPRQRAAETSEPGDGDFSSDEHDKVDALSVSRSEHGAAVAASAGHYLKNTKRSDDYPQPLLAEDYSDSDEDVAASGIVVAVPDSEVKTSLESTAPLLAANLSDSDGDSAYKNEPFSAAASPPTSFVAKDSRGDLGSSASPKPVKAKKKKKFLDHQHALNKTDKFELPVSSKEKRKNAPVDERGSREGSATTSKKKKNVTKKISQNDGDIDDIFGSL